MESQQSKSGLSKFYNTPGVFKTLNISGIFIGIIGILLCFGLIFGSYSFDQRTRTETRRIERRVLRYLDHSRDVLETLRSHVDGFTLLEDAQKEVNGVVNENVDRLTTLNETLAVLNFGNKLNRPTKQVDSAIESLKKLVDVGDNIVSVKARLLERLDNLIAQVDNAIQQVRSSARSIRNVAMYSFMATFLIAIIFITGQIALIRQCSGALKRRRLNVKTPIVT